MEKDLLLIGAGKMGTALIQGWLSKGISKNNITIIEPNEINSSKLIDLGLKVFDSLVGFDKLIKQSVIVLAVKPQIIESVAVELKDVKSNQGIKIDD